MLQSAPASRSPTADQTLPVVLFKLRKERGATQEALASNAGLTTRSYQKIERGYTSPEWATVRRIAQALDVGLVELAQAVVDAEA
jgi:transcriptional regulator with XRE-family HTH domain